MTTRPVIVLLSTGLAALLIGCGTPEPPPGAAQEPTQQASETRTLPPRPRDVPAMVVNPCNLLQPPQLEELGVGTGEPGTTPQADGLVCQWDNTPNDPEDNYLITGTDRVSADVVLNADASAEIEVISGYGAVSTISPEFDPAHNCVFVVDVAEGQVLIVRYDSTGVNVSTSREQACEKARRAATFAVQNLLTRA